MSSRLASSVNESALPNGSPAGVRTQAPASNGLAAQALSPVAAPASRSLRFGAVWVVVGRCLGIGITVMVNIALARWLTPQDFGNFLLLSSVLGLASLVAMLGLNIAVVRFVSESLGKGDLARAQQTMWLIMSVAGVSIASVAGLAAVTFAYWGRTLLGLPDLPGIVPMAVTGLVLLAVLQLIAEACRSLHELRLASLFSGGQTGGLLSSVLFLMLLAAAIVLGKPSLFAAVILSLVAMAISLPIAIFGLSTAARSHLVEVAPLQPVKALTLRQLLAFSIPMLLIQLLTFTTSQADLWIAGICCPHDELALYGAARRLMVLVTMPLQMLNLTVISSIAELYGQDRLRELERVLRGAASVAAWPSIGAILLLVFAGGPILETLFGAYFRQAAAPLAILGIGQFFFVCAGSSGCALEMTGHQMNSLVVNLISAITLATVGTWAAMHFGLVGLATASASTITVHSITQWLLAKRLVGVWTHPALKPFLSRP